MNKIKELVNESLKMLEAVSVASTAFDEKGLKNDLYRAKYGSIKEQDVVKAVGDKATELIKMYGKVQNLFLDSKNAFNKGNLLQASGLLHSSYNEMGALLAVINSLADKTK